MSADPTQRLLAFLRAELGDGGITFASPPRAMTGGAFSEVFAFQLAGTEGVWTHPLVLRLYATNTDAVQPTLEQAFQNGVADAGYLAPRVLKKECSGDVLDRMFVIMERLGGRSALRGVRADQFVRDFPRLVVSWPSRLARVAHALHQVDVRPVMAAVAEHGLSADDVATSRHINFVEQQLTQFGGTGMAEAGAWLRDCEPPRVEPSVVHGDLWPGNVLMARGELSGLVDWNVASIGDAALDIGFAKAGLALMPSPFPPPPPVAQLINWAGRSMANRLERHYNQLRPVPSVHVTYFEALRCLLELSTVVRYQTLPPDARADEAPPPWANGVQALTRHFTNLTGVSIRLPTRST